MRRIGLALGLLVGVSLVLQPCAVIQGQTLPGEPAPPPASDSRHLSTEEGLKTAIDWAKYGQEPSTDKLVDVAIGIMTVAYPPAGIALGFAKALVMSGGPDPVGSALKALNERINALNQRLDKLQQEVNALRDDHLRLANRERLRWLLDHRDDLENLSYRLGKKPTERNEKDTIAHEAQVLAARFLAANDPDQDLWQWSDVRVFTDRNTRRLASQMLPADFKPLPTFEYYVSALVLWMSAIEYASDGDPRYVTGNRTLVNNLLRHAAYLSVRPPWRELEANDSPATLPEQIMRRITCFVKPVGKYPTNLMCDAVYMCEDNLRRTETGVGTAQFSMPSNNMMCSLRMREPRQISAQEQEARVAAFRRNPVYGSQAMSEWQRWRTPLVAPQEETLEQGYGIEVMTLLADKLVRLAKFGTTSEQYIGTFDPTTASYNLLYAVKPNGELLWYMHRMGTRPRGWQPPSDAGGIDRNTEATSRAGQRPRREAPAARRPSTRVGDILQTIEQARRGSTRVESSVLASGAEVLHAWDGPKRVGDGGWQNFRDVMPGGGSGIYALTQEGTLKWYRHDGFLNGTVQWMGPTDVSSGWNRFSKVVAAGDGVLYGIAPNGTLVWYKHSGFDDGAATLAGPTVVGTGWAAFKHVFSGGEGILYAITQDGKLVWYKHKAYLDAVAMPAGRASGMVGAGMQLNWIKSWEDLNARVVGTGWGGFMKVFSPGNGHIYAIKPTGELLWYRHDGYKDGTARWQEPVEIAADWKDFLFVFPRMLGAWNSRDVVR